jgi:hypothetical protein
VLGATHRGSVRLRLDDWWGPESVHAIRAYVPAGPTTSSAVSRPIYVRTFWPRTVGITAPAAGSTGALAATAMTCIRAHASASTLGRTAALACDRVLAARRAGTSPREAARNILGR